MSSISKPYTFSPNTSAASSEVNSNFDTIYNDYNGGISATNLADSAVSTAKIADDAVTNDKLADASVFPEQLVAGAGTDWAWQDWTPTWTNFTVGSAAIEAKYCQIGKTVFFRLRVLLSGSTMGTSPIFSLPVTAATYPGTTKTTITTAVLLTDYGSAVWAGYGVLNNTTTCSLLQYAAALTPLQAQVGITATTPFTWANNDEITLQGFYQAA